MRAWIASKGVRRTEPEYELRDALGQPGCAVCRLALRTAARQLDILSYENVNDLDLRAKLRESRGFCNRHAWQLLEQTRDPLGVALIYKDVINTLVPELRPDGTIDSLLRLVRRQSASGLAGRLAAMRECTVCLAERETESVYLRLLGLRVADPAFREVWEASAGLCWPHLLAALPQARSDDALSLLARWAASLPPPAGEGQGASSQTIAARELALTHGRWSADRSTLPQDLVVDLQQRKLEAVTRPAGDAEPACHACREVAALMGHELASMWSAGVEAATIGSTCERHAWQIAGRGAAALEVPLAGLMVERRQALAAALERARAEQPSVMPPGRSASAWIGERAAAHLVRSAHSPSRACPFCERESDLDRETAAGAIGMRRPVALCRAHLMLGSPSPAGSSDWAWLLRHQSERWRALSADLAEFIKKHDYRFSQEVRGDERDSPWRAVEEIAGRRGAR